MTYWRIPRLWPGETVAVLAGGQSLSAAQVRRVALAKLAGKCRAIAVNDAVYLAWWADWLHACDRTWWDWHSQSATRFPGMKTTLDETLPEAWGVKVLKNTGKLGFDIDPACCRTGGNGAYQAIHCALHAGARRVLLLGVDMHGTHWFGNHPVPGSTDYSKTMVPAFETLLPALAECGAEVINCSPGSKLDCFPRRELAACV